MDENEYKQKLNDAYELHIKGSFVEAKTIYEELLKVNPDDMDLVNLYAQVVTTLGDYDLAIDLFYKVYDKVKQDTVLINISKVYIKKAEYQKVIDILSSCNSNTIEKYKILALCYNALKKFDMAIECYKKILEFNPENTEVLLLISSFYIDCNDYENALKYSLMALEIKKDINMLFNTAFIYKNMNNDEKAVEYFDKILEIDPDNKEALLNISNIYKNYDKNVSVDILKKLNEKYPTDDSILGYMYVLYVNMMKNEEALDTALMLIKLKPDVSSYYSFAADSYLALYQYNEALDMYKKASELKPDVEYVQLQIAYIYSVLNRPDMALAILEKYKDTSESALIDYTYLMCKYRKNLAVKEEFYKRFRILRPDDSVVSTAKKLFYKLNIQSTYGIDEEEFLQLKNTNRKSAVSLYLSEYGKKSLKDNCPEGKRILLYSMHGVGDFIMASRYINKLKQVASKIVLQIPSSCISLYKYNFPDIEIFSIYDELNLDDFDYTASFFELFYSLNIDFSNIEKIGNYLSVSDEKVKEKADFDFIKTDKKKVGIFWQGNPTICLNRSMKLKDFTALLELNNVQLYSFQISKIDNESEKLKPELDIIDLAPYINSYEDTAGFLKNIDILLTIDSSIAHLGGAMGIKTFLMLPFDPEWRWFDNTEKTEWYDSIKIFKQNEAGNWLEVISRVKDELSI